MIANIERKLSLRYKVPRQILPNREWELDCKRDPHDKRTCDTLKVSFGYPPPRQFDCIARDVSITIGNQVAILDPFTQNTLIKLMLDAGKE